MSTVYVYSQTNMQTCGDQVVLMKKNKICITLENTCQTLKKKKNSKVVLHSKTKLLYCSLQVLKCDACNHFHFYPLLPLFLPDDSVGKSVL